jgi:uncharacterized Zn finger protein
MRSVVPQKRLTSWWAQGWVEIYPLYSKKVQRYSHGLEDFFYGVPTAERTFRNAVTMAREGSIYEPEIDGTAVRATFHAWDSFHSFSPWIMVEAIPDAAWARVFEQLASQARFLADLLRGTLPADLPEIFRKAGVDLLPRHKGDLVGGCDCHDFTPCVHLCALHYVIGDAIERDPFLLFELRGRPRARFLEELHRARLALLPGHSPRPAGVSLAGVSLDTYDTLPAELPQILDPPAPPKDVAMALRTLKSPAGWSEKENPATLLSPVLEAASQQASSLLLHPGKIRVLTVAPSAADPRVLRASRLLERKRSSRVLPALSCIALALRSLRGDDPEVLLEEFSVLLASPRARLDTWWKQWIPAVFLDAPAVRLALVVLPIQGQLSASGLVGLLPAGPSALLWSVEREKDAHRARIKARRKMLERINELVPESQEIALVAELSDGGDAFESYLDLLGWSYALQEGNDGPAISSSPDALALLEQRATAREAAQPPLLASEAAAPLASDPTEAQIERILWLRVLGRELLGLLGSISLALVKNAQEAPVSRAERGRQVYEELATMKDARANALLRSWADALEAHPAFTGLFAGR